MIRLIPAVAILLALALPARAQSLTLTPAQMVAAANNALELSRPAAALALAEALLQRDPGDFAALLVRSRALRDLGRAQAAQVVARTAWGAAKTGDQKFAAAVIMAQAASSNGQRTVAQAWLRRAAQHARTPAQHALVRRDFTYVRARNPLSFNLSFGAMPSSNINGGANTDTITLFGLPFELSPDAQALSGYQAYFSGALSYRLGENERSETRIGVKAYGRWNRLSAQAQAAAPGASGHDYDYHSVALTFSHERLAGGPGRILSFGLDLGRNWYGGTVLSDFVQARAGYETRLARGARLTLDARADMQIDAGTSAARTWLATLGSTLRMPLKNGATLHYGAEAMRSFSTDANRAYGELSADAGYTFARPVLGTRLTLGAQIAWREYPVSYYSSNGRRDLTLAAKADFRLENMSFYGFSPVLTLERSHTSSNVSLYGNDRTSIGLSFRSDF